MLSVAGFYLWGAGCLIGAIIITQRVGFERGVRRNITRAISKNEAQVVHCQSNEMVSLEEIDGEGPDYCFQINESRLFFINGEEYCESRRFPNTDFEIVRIYGDKDYVVFFRVYCRGKKLLPLKVIPAERKKNLMSVLPADCTILRGRLEGVQEVLLKALKPKIK
jgi:hypothetical protein